MTLLELAQVIRQTIIQATPLDDGHVILAKQTPPRPSGSYATIDAALNSNVGWGYKNYSPNNEDLNEKNTQLVNSQISIQFMREFSNDYILLLNAALTSQTIIDLWNTNNIGLIEKSPIREVSQIISASYEARFQMDITVMFEHSYTNVVTGVNSARVTGEIDNGNAVIANIDIQP